MLGQFSLFQPSMQLPLRRRVSVEIIEASEARYTLEKLHYLHRRRTGAQINYAVYVNGQIDGVITFAYPMMSTDLLGVPSDEVLEFARLYLYQNIPHTATCAIGKVLRRVRADWKRRFPLCKVPRLVVSYSDTEFHKGTIYKAANFVWYKRTKGDKRKSARNSATSKRGFRKQTVDYSHDKDCWLYALNAHDRKMLDGLAAAP